MTDPTYVVNVEGAVVRDGEYLLVERAAAEDHAPGRLAFPGGTVEQGPGTESPVETTVRRELSEEVGVAVGAVEYVHSRTFAADEGATVLDVVTLCAYADGPARPRDPDEVAGVHWLPPDEVRGRDDAPEYLVRDVERVEQARRAP